MQCSFVKNHEFNPTKSNISIAKVESEGIITPIVDCDGSGCVELGYQIPECVRVCPTGALLYVPANEARKKRQELIKARAVQPVFRFIAPWKWPYPPWKEWPFNGE